MPGLTGSRRDPPQCGMIPQSPKSRLVSVFFAVGIGCRGCLVASPVIQHFGDMKNALLRSLPSLCQHFRYTAQYQIIVLGAVTFRSESQPLHQFRIHDQEMADIVIT